MGFAASIAGKRRPVRCLYKNLFFNSCSDLFQEQSMAQTESAILASCLQSNIEENGFKTRVFFERCFTGWASLNLASLAAVHLKGSSCFSINTKAFIIPLYFFLDYKQTEAEDQ